MQKRTQTLYQYLRPLVWNDSKTNTIQCYRFAIQLSFDNGCKNWFLGVKKFGGYNTEYLFFIIFW